MDRHSTEDLLQCLDALIKRTVGHAGSPPGIPHGIQTSDFIH
jgi:hypothetical protein